MNFKINKDYKLSLIDFRYSGDWNLGNWSENRERFESIIQAISESELKNSLKTLRLNGCGFDTPDVAKEILDTYGMAEVEVTFELTKPIEF